MSIFEPGAICIPPMELLVCAVAAVMLPTAIPIATAARNAVPVSLKLVIIVSYVVLAVAHTTTEAELKTQKKSASVHFDASLRVRGMERYPSHLITDDVGAIRLFWT